MPEVSERHFRNSSHREKIVEHIFVGELLRHFWITGLANVEILKPEVDSTGYDVVVTHGPTIRHVQLKASIAGGSTKYQKVNASLANHSSGCVVWIIVGDDLSFKRFLWFGDAPGKPLPSLAQFKMAKNTRANAQGVKQIRENTMVIPKGKFVLVENMAALVKLLFGSTSI